MANKTEKLEKQVASNYKDAMEAATVSAYYAKENKMLLEENAKLRELVPGGSASGRDGGSSDWVDKWIPISHYLPAHNQTVLVWRDGGLLSILNGSAQITTFRLLRTGPAWECDVNEFPVPPSLLRNVTHWMPLPTKPTTDSLGWR